MGEVEAIWTGARYRAESRFDPDPPSRGRPSRPSRGQRRLLLSIYREGPGYVSDLARRTGVCKGNASDWLKIMDRYALLNMYESPGLAGAKQGGGRIPKVYELTMLGKKLAQAIERECP